MLSLLGWIIFGFVVGLVARALLPGRDQMGLLATTLLGIIGAILGGWLGETLGFYGYRQQVGFIGALLGAILLLIAYNAISSRQRV